MGQAFGLCASDSVAHAKAGISSPDDVTITIAPQRAFDAAAISQQIKALSYAARNPATQRSAAVARALRGMLAGDAVAVPLHWHVSPEAALHCSSAESGNRLATAFLN